MQLYKGDKPCAGCGKSGREVPRVYADQICSDCKQLINNGKIYRAMMADQEADGIKLFMYPMQVWDGQSNIANKIMLQFFELVRSLNQKGIKIADTIYLGQYNSNRVEVVVSRKIAEEAIAMYTHLKEKLPSLYEKGKEHGSNLLMQLNSGDLTMSKFNDSIKKSI